MNWATKKYLILSFITTCLMVSFELSDGKSILSCKTELIAVDKNTDQSKICNKYYRFINQLYITDTILSCPKKIRKVNLLCYTYYTKFNSNYEAVDMLVANTLKIDNNTDNPIDFNEIIKQIHSVEMLRIYSETINIIDTKDTSQIKYLELVSNNINYIPKSFNTQFPKLKYLTLYSNNFIAIDNNFKYFNLEGMNLNILDDSLTFNYLNLNEKIESLEITNREFPKNFKLTNNIKKCGLTKNGQFNVYKIIDSLSIVYPKVLFYYKN